MKMYFFQTIFIICSITIYGQTKIPELIKTDLTLRPISKPYESTGFTVEKGATLTILPGTKIKMANEINSKFAPNIKVNGALVIGAKGAEISKPVIIEGNCMNVIFSDATIDLNGLELNAAHIIFQGNNTGMIKNCSFLISKGFWYKFEINVPKTGVLTIKDCLIEDKDLVIKSTDFPNDLDNLVLNKCAFTTKLDASGKKFNQHFMPITAFAYGTKCDSYLEIEFKAFDWVLTKSLTSEWHIGDERIRKMTDDSAKTLKTFSLKLGTKPFTKFKQEEAPNKDAKK